MMNRFFVLSVFLAFLIFSLTSVKIFACSDKEQAVTDAERRVAAAEDAVKVASASKNTGLIGIAIDYVKNSNTRSYKSGSYDPAGRMQRSFEVGMSMSALDSARNELSAAQTALSTAKEALENCKNPKGACGHAFPGHPSMRWSCGHDVYICQGLNHVSLTCYSCSVTYYRCATSTCMAGSYHY